LKDEKETEEWEKKSRKETSEINPKQNPLKLNQRFFRKHKG